MAQKQWSSGSAGGQKNFPESKAHDAMAGTGSKKVGGAHDGGFKPPASKPKDGSFSPPVGTPKGGVTQHVGSMTGKGTGRGA